jgi:hypothetical protein
LQLNYNNLAQRVKDDIDAYCVRTYSDEHRSHLGASIMGNDCAAYQWFVFRWVRKEIFSARMLRLFNRGHKEEARWIEWLRGIGFTIWEVDPTTGKQFRIWGAKGHYGGSADSVGITPYAEITEPMLCEFKTHNYKSFSNLVNKKTVKLAKPAHYAQMCQYGQHYGFKYGLYCASGKNDDDIHVEVVELDFQFADDLKLKAEDIITSRVRPPKISLQPSYFECKYCPMAGVCHRGEKPETNCRSCEFAYPVENAEWFCSHYQQIIPKDFIPQGCPTWKPII